MKKVRFFFKSLQVVVLLVVLYVAYAAIIDVKGFFQNPWQAILDPLPFEIKTEIDVNVLKDELLKKSEYIFAENQMKLEYKFHRKVRLAEVSATYHWLAITKFGITKDCFSVNQEGDDLIIDVHKVKIFKTINDNVKRVKYDENWGWSDQGTTERAFRQDMPFAARDAFYAKFSDSKKQQIVNYGQESLKSFVRSFLEDKDINIIVKVSENFERKAKLSGEPSGYYKDQRRSVLEDLTMKVS